MFFQFGFELESGTYPWRNHVTQNTSDWLGPYNLVLPQHLFHITSRYVTTVATDYMHPLPNMTWIDPSLFDTIIGPSAVHRTIDQQIHLQPKQDPYERQKDSCTHGDIAPILPRFDLTKHSQLQLDYLLLSTSDKDMKWSTFQNHLPDFPVLGPYCFQGNADGVYALNISYDTLQKENNTWTLTQGCVPGLPCWPGEDNHNHPPKPHGGGDDDGNGGGTGRYAIIWKAVSTYGIYFVLIALVISWTFNCQLSYQLQRERDEQNRNGSIGEGEDGGTIRRRRRRRIAQQTPTTTITTTTTTTEDPESSLQEPLLESSTKNTRTSPMANDNNNNEEERSEVMEGRDQKKDELEIQDTAATKELLEQNNPSSSAV